MRLRLVIITGILCVKGCCAMAERWTLETQPSQKGRFLFVMPTLPKSGVITLVPIVESLLRRGHNVRAVTSFPLKVQQAKNGAAGVLEARSLPSVVEFFDEASTFISSQMANASMFHVLAVIAPKMATYTQIISDLILKDRETRDFLFSADADVVIAPVASGELGSYIAYKRNVTLITYSNQQSAMIQQDIPLGQPNNPSFQPSIMASFRHPMNLVERFLNTLLWAWIWYYIYVVQTPQVEKLFDEYFPEDAGSRPRIMDMQGRALASLHFGNPFIMDGMRPTSPNFIQVGMMNCRPPQPITDKKLAAVLNSDRANKSGLVYFAFGTILKMSSLPDGKLDMVLRVLGRLEQQVVMKWERTDIARIPKNVELFQWLPQQDILGHSNTRLFISHGGQSSCQESWCHKVPMFISSVYGDQKGNGDEVERRGIGIHIPFKDLTEEDFYNGIITILNDPKFAENAKIYRELLLDQLNKPIEKAIWWLEYALRHPDYSIYTSPATDLAWYQYYLLDVLAVLMTVTMTSLVLSLLCCRCLYRRCTRTTKIKSKKE